MLLSPITYVNIIKQIKWISFCLLTSVDETFSIRRHKNSDMFEFRRRGVDVHGEGTSGSLIQ